MTVTHTLQKGALWNVREIRGIIRNKENSPSPHQFNVRLRTAFHSLHTAFLSGIIHSDRDSLCHGIHLRVHRCWASGVSTNRTRCTEDLAHTNAQGFLSMEANTFRYNSGPSSHHGGTVNNSRFELQHLVQIVTYITGILLAWTQHTSSSRISSNSRLPMVAVSSTGPSGKSSLVPSSHFRFFFIGVV